MNHERACGAVVYTKKNNEILYLIVKSIKGDYGFPKGHAENDESDIQTASREILEETGVNVNFINDFKFESEYHPDGDQNILKHLILFLAYFENQEISTQKEELLSADLMNFQSALNVLKFDNLKNALRQADDFIKSHKI